MGDGGAIDIGNPDLVVTHGSIWGEPVVVGLTKGLHPIGVDLDLG